MIYYLGVRFSDETNRALTEYRLLNSLSETRMPKLYFHTTIVYSKTPFTFTIGKLPRNSIGICEDDAELYGTSIVLPYKSICLSMIYGIVVSSGAVSDYKSYMPHITIAEDCDETYLDKIERKPNIPIVMTEVFYKEYDKQS